jgi:hypothetical protein
MLFQNIRIVLLTKNMNQIEIQYIHHFDKFITFLLGEKNVNDPEQRIYNKLLELEGEELERWVQEKLKYYITGEGDHNAFAGEEFEGIQRRILFTQWYYSPMTWSEPEQHLLWLDDFYDDKTEEEINQVRNKIYRYQGLIVREYSGSWKMEMMTDYLEMYIANMRENCLKEYIKQIMDPVEPR